MGKVDFKANRAFIGGLLRSDGVLRVVEDAARRVEASAVAGAPVRSGDYQSSIGTVTGVSGDRAKARVGSTDPGAIAIERRTGNLKNALGSA